MPANPFQVKLHAVGFAAILLFSGSQGFCRADLPAKVSRKFEYRDQPRMWISPSGRATLRFTFKPAKDGLGINMLEFASGNNQPSIRYEFQRDIDGEWSPSSDVPFINDYEGSNYFDCLLPSLGRKPRLVSLGKILRKNPRSGPREPGVKPPETPDNSGHYYLVCLKWIDAASIAVKLYGDTEAGGSFNYMLKYLVGKRRYEVLSIEEARQIGGIDWNS